MREAAKHMKWTRKRLEEFGFKQTEGNLLRVDNQGVLLWGSQGIRHVKHVSIRLNFVKECIERGIPILLYCKSSEIVADILTKPLFRLAFEKHRNVLCQGFAPQR